MDIVDTDKSLSTFSIQTTCTYSKNSFSLSLSPRAETKSAELSTVCIDRLEYDGLATPSPAVATTSLRRPISAVSSPMADTRPVIEEDCPCDRGVVEREGVAPLDRCFQIHFPETTPRRYPAPTPARTVRAV